MKVIELFSGIGGMHLALKESGVQGEVILAADINPIANEIYKHNFPEVQLLNRNIQSLSADYLNKFQADTILMSPPCQPFTRNGLKSDTKDPRAASLLHIIEIIPKLNITRILLENVKGFETSHMRDLLIEALVKCKFSVQEFLLNSSQFSIPNSRLRYYCLAKKLPLTLEFPMAPLLNYLPHQDRNNICTKIGDILESEENEEYNLPLKYLHKYWKILDICYKESRRSCCFTKGYGRYAEGTGSVFTNLTENDCKQIIKQLEQENVLSNESLTLQLLESLNIRYFTPIEVSRLQCFPPYFSFPEKLTTRQKFMVLGNSINVDVVSRLIKLLE